MDIRNWNAKSGESVYQGCATKIFHSTYTVTLFDLVLVRRSTFQWSELSRTPDSGDGPLRLEVLEVDLLPKAILGQRAKLMLWGVDKAQNSAKLGSFSLYVQRALQLLHIDRGPSTCSLPGARAFRRV